MTIGDRLSRDQVVIKGKRPIFVLVSGDLESESRSMFPFRSTKCSISSLLSIKFNFKTPGFVLPIYVVPLISCSFHDSLPVRPLIDILPSITYGSFVRLTFAPANAMPSGIAFRLLALGAAECVRADGTSAPGAFRSRALTPSRP